MFYSLTQQLVRQDPGWYAVQVALRPDHCPHLICYPYVTRDAQGDNNAFLHMDINLEKFLIQNQGESQLTSSVSLDDEEADGCTLVVPKFHRRRVHKWYAGIVKRGQNKSGTTTDASKRYLSQDREKFGKPIPAPCPAGGVRLTRPDIIHGSTSKMPRQRRVLYSWHTAIQQDLKTLEIPGQLTWDEISNCHLNMVAPTRGVGGEAITHSLPPYRFPAAIAMESVSPLCDALIGRRNWNDPEVLMERDIVLGDDDGAALEYISRTREKLLNSFMVAASKLEKIERLAFGNNSFFTNNGVRPEEQMMEGHD